MVLLFLFLHAIISTLNFVQISNLFESVYRSSEIKEEKQITLAITEIELIAEEDIKVKCPLYITNFYQFLDDCLPNMLRAFKAKTDIVNHMSFNQSRTKSNAFATFESQK